MLRFCGPFLAKSIPKPIRRSRSASSLVGAFLRVFGIRGFERGDARVIRDCVLQNSFWAHPTLWQGGHRDHLKWERLEAKAQFSALLSIGSH